MNPAPQNHTAHYPIPIVRLIVLDERNRVLILKRKNTTHSPGEWCLPGGKVDYGRTVEEAAMDELFEETSLACTSLTFLFYQDSLPLQPGGMHCINLYFATSVKGAVVLNEESSEYAWIGPEDLPHYPLAFRNEPALRQYWRDKAEETGR